MNTPSPSPAVARAILSAELKKLRAKSGQTQDAVAQACEMSVAKFSRIENGAPVSKGDLLLVLRHYGITDARRVDELAQLARDARSPGWWQQYSFGDDKGFEAYVGYEDGASSIHMSQPHVIPGLLQTPSYSARIMKAWGIPEQAIQNKLRLREERQERVAARQPEQIYILDDDVITRPVTNDPDDDTRPDLLRHLLKVAAKPHVTIRVIPRSRGHHFGLRGPFVLLGFDGELDDVLYIESAKRGDLLISEDREQVGGPSAPKFENPGGTVAEFQDGFRYLQQIALSEEETLAFIEQERAKLLA